MEQDYQTIIKLTIQCIHSQYNLCQSQWGDECVNRSSKCHTFCTLREAGMLDSAHICTMQWQGAKVRMCSEGKATLCSIHPVAVCMCVRKGWI